MTIDGTEDLLMPIVDAEILRKARTKLHMLMLVLLVQKYIY